MKKKNVLKLALMGLTIGTAVCGCSGNSSDSDKGSCSNQSSCNGNSGCNSQSSLNSKAQGDLSSDMKAKREIASNEISKE